MDCSAILGVGLIHREVFIICYENGATRRPANNSCFV